MVESITTCMQCGTCSASCVSKSSFNLRRIVMDFVLNYADSASYLGGIWDCTTCLTCQTRCPRGIPLTDVIVDSRKKLVERGKIPSEIRDIFISLQKFKNPFGVPAQERKSWLKDLKIKKEINDVSEAEYFWFIGCFNSVDMRSRTVVEKIADIFDEIGINYGINELEGCCGNDVYSMGEEGLFELLKDENIRFFEENRIKKIITTSPHCYNAFKNYYSYPVHVYTPIDIIHSAIMEEKLKFNHDVTYSVTYHDPCFLGRYNGVYEKPREILKSIYNIEIVEMQRIRENSFCCGGGSGNFMRGNTRPNIQRAKEAIRTSADILSVSCPLCLNMLEDGLRSLNSDMKVMDVVELVHMAVFGE